MAEVPAREQDGHVVSHGRLRVRATWSRKTYFPCLPGASPPDRRNCVGLMVMCVGGLCQLSVVVVVVVVMQKAEVVWGETLEIGVGPLASNGAKPEQGKRLHPGTVHRPCPESLELSRYVLLLPQIRLVMAANSHPSPSTPLLP